MKRRHLLYLLTALCFSLLPLQGVKAAPAEKKYETQTIMVYIVGADLESDGGMATADILEMLKAKPDKQRLNVLVMTGGTKQWKSRTIPTDKLSVFKIEGMNPKPVHQWEQGSMGEPATLTRFLEYGVATYPADSYGLILWDHGGGPLVGFGVDTAHKNDGLTLFELREALKASHFGKGQRLEWLAFDACLMASLEVASLLAEYADHMIASEEALPGRGFDYKFLSDLAGTGLTGPEVARPIIDRTYAFYKEFAAKNPENLFPVTLSLMDLSKVRAVQQKLDQMFASLDKGLQAGIYSDIARSRDKTKDYGRSRTTNDYDLIDLADLSDNMAALYPRQADELRAAIGDMVLYNKSNAPRTNGLSIYFPLRNKNMYSQMWGKLYQEFDIAPAYRVFMEKFGSILLADSLSKWTGEDTPTVTFDEGTGEYFIQLTPEQVKNYERGEYYVLAQLEGEEYLLNYMSSDVTLDAQNRLRANFNGKTMFLEDPALQNSVIPYMAEKENIQQVASYQIPIVLARTDNAGQLESLRAQLLAEINKDTQEARIVGAIRDDEGASLMGKRDLELSSWDNAYLIYNSSYLTRDEQGSILPLGDWASSDIPKVISYDVKKGLNVRYGALQADLYDFFVLISIVDTQGNVSSSQLMPLKSGTVPTGERPPVKRPQAKTLEYPAGSNQPLLLIQEQGIKITLAGIEQINANPQYPDASATLTLNFLLENELDEEEGVEVDWAAVNGIMINTSSYAAIPARGSAVMTLDLPLDGSPIGSSLLASGITRAEDIRFRFELNRNLVNYFKRSFTQEIQILTGINLQVSNQSVSQVKEAAKLLAQEGSVTIEQLGDPMIRDDELYVPLKITNASDIYDTVRLDQSSVNGIMAPMTMQEDVPPGTVLYTQARIAAKRTIVPQELAQYQYMYDGIDNLEALGIDQVKEVTLRFALELNTGEGRPIGGTLRHLMQPVSILAPGMGSFVQQLDTQGDELFNLQGIRIVRLQSDPAGKKIYIQNSSPHAIHISTFGNVKADGENYAANMPIYATVSPGKSAYANLFGFLPGIEPQASELTFYIDVINLDSNTLLAQSGKVTLKFPMGQ